MKLLLLFFGLSCSTRLLKQDLDDYDLAKCNDGTPGSYFYDQDVRGATRKVLIYLPDGGDCSTVKECKRRCKSSSDEDKCTASEEATIERTEGFWSEDPLINPFYDYFKVSLHYCSSDNFAGTRGASDSTGDLYFQGRHILSSTLRDLVAKFGIDQATSVVLVGSGSGARGVGYNCDFVADALRSVNPSTDVRCIADAPDFVPWWVKTDTEKCENKDYELLEEEKFLWGRADDESCVEDNEDVVNSTELAHKCGIWSRYFSHIETPFFLIGSQYDPFYFNSAPCSPDEDDPDYEEYVSSWKRGMLALYESAVIDRPSLGLFVPNCNTHTLLNGDLAASYWAKLRLPLLQSEDKASLPEMLTGWVNQEYRQAIDPLGAVNDQCIAPQQFGLRPCGSRLGCNRGLGGIRSSVLADYDYYDYGDYGDYGDYDISVLSTRRRLQPPTNLYPKGYNRDRRFYGTRFGLGGLGGRRVGLGARRFGLGGLGGTRVGLAGTRVGLGGTRVGLTGTRVGLGGTRVGHPAGKKTRLWRRLRNLQYLRNLYNKQKTNYARDYYAGWDDYGDYGDYFLSRIQSAVQVNSGDNKKVGRKGLLEDSVVKDRKDVETNIEHEYEYEDFGSIENFQSNKPEKIQVKQ